MLEMKKISILIYFAIIGVTLVAYFFTDIFCGGNCYPFVHGTQNMVYTWALGLIPTLAIFVFFGKRIFESWVRHIAWWFTIIIAFAGRNLTEGVLSPSEEYIVNAAMVLLFIITLIYAVVMKRKYTNESPK